MLTVTQATSSSCPEVVEPPQAMSTVPVEAPSVFDAGDILIPSPVSTLHYFRGSSNLLNTGKSMLCLQLPPVALRKSQGQEDQRPLLVMCLLHNKED